LSPTAPCSRHPWQPRSLGPATARGATMAVSVDSKLLASPRTTTAQAERFLIPSPMASTPTQMCAHPYPVLHGRPQRGARPVAGHRPDGAGDRLPVLVLGSASTAQPSGDRGDRTTRCWHLVPELEGVRARAPRQAGRLCLAGEHRHGSPEGADRRSPDVSSAPGVEARRLNPPCVAPHPSAR
jgi:hypothetical protein